MKKFQNKQTGFTLIEMVVATGIFSMLAISAVSIMIAVSKAQAKIQRTQAAIDNIRYSLELITKEMRVGTQYKLISPNECGDSGTDEINFVASTPAGSQRRYFIDTDAGGVKRLMRIKKTTGAISSADCSSAISLSADEVTVDRFRMVPRGNTASPGSTDGQPWIVINLKVSAIDPKGVAHSTMDLQTSITQRIRDFP
ncbi:MAG: hypothetical protein A2847_02685 [Candidatus Sungbacteria bacterium RIFCSPHIGHO2_01_FULL_50_25]|uniref:Type II secretion system protein J n=1 Tax=Candidatus Sungbacteria bacterium RIFCSPHIGHO2_01_FULL_50_25 TaxID=1802265 RepID=A0A1G2KEL6_9BACT|nr:MAG: hypothetical protein A2847_02685 [Candidatus Sungbacteria bacterium RIFCSPHIGHO2_01_FULL_50_25]